MATCSKLTWTIAPNGWHRAHTANWVFIIRQRKDRGWLLQQYDTEDVVGLKLARNRISWVVTHSLEQAKRLADDALTAQPDH